MEQTRKRDTFTTIRTEGGLLPADLLERIAAGDKSLDGLNSLSYHLAPNEKITEAVSRSWNRMRGYWEAFRAAAEKLPTGDVGTSLTRDRWLLPLFNELGYGRLQRAENIEAAGKPYPVSHAWGQVPFHLVGFNVDMDRRTAKVAGAAQAAPHALVQELLNRSDDHLWAFVSNGKRLRMLRDNAALTRQAYIEFDLEAMFEGDVYPDFVLLWMLCHQSRIEADKPSEFWLEKWSQTAQQEGTRALDALRNGVEKAIVALGSGFLIHPANRELRAKLQTSGGLDKQEFYRQLLRIVYKFLFLFVAEDRDLLLDPQADAKARERYTKFYATTRLRRLAEKQRGTRHSDLWNGLTVVLDKLHGGCPELGLPALGSFLFRADKTPDLAGCELANHALLEAVRALCQVRDGNVLRTVNYKNLQTEELGSVYESLLELHPEMNVDAGGFTLRSAGGSERKTTGSYYTPDSLVQCLLDSALDPVLDEAVKQPDPEKAILALTVCDPACGSGHFLIAAAHRMAKRLASVRTGEGEPAPEATRAALRDIIGRCLYGVDLNPMAVELCKVALWMEALVPGKPLSFLDHHIQCGNALLGTTPDLMAQGIPDDAFTPIEGDDKAYCTTYKKQNKKEREARAKREAASKAGQVDLFRLSLGNLAGVFARLTDGSDERPEDVRAKEERYANIIASNDYLYGRFLADSWCSAFVWKKQPELFNFPITEDIYRRIEEKPQWAEPWLRDEVKRLACQYSFLHWHLSFPEVFGGAGGGFSVILGNPPWDIVEFSEEEYFTRTHPQIANASSARQRQAAIARLAKEEPETLSAFTEARRHIHAVRSFIQRSSRFPLSSVGRINLYPLFVEVTTTIIKPSGCCGIIVPSAIAIEAYNAELFRHFIDNKRLHSLFDFENKLSFFPAVDSRYRFCLFTHGSNNSVGTGFDVCFVAHNTEDVRNPKRRLRINYDELSLFSPNTLAIPILRQEREYHLAKKVYAVNGVLHNKVKEVNPWGIEIQRMLSLSDPGDLFRNEDELRSEKNPQDWERMYTGKAIHSYNHRFSYFFSGKWLHPNTSQLQDPHFEIPTQYYVRASEVSHRLSAKALNRWLIGYRDIARATDERTAIASVVPAVGCDSHCRNIYFNLDSILFLPCLLASINSFVFDFFARQKIIGTGLGAGIFEQLPVLAPASYEGEIWWGNNTQNVRMWIAARVLELTYTAYDLTSFARDCGYHGKPFRWDEDRRYLLRCELDAVYFHLYGITHDDADYILDSFPIVRRKDEAAHGEYRTKRVILEIYDEIAAGHYETRLSPPPANGWTPPEHLLPIPAAIKSQPLTSPVEAPALEDIVVPEPLANTPCEIELPAQQLPTPKANVFFQRAVLGAEIVSQLHDNPSFGHVKFMKVFEVCELDADLGDLETQYYRQAAGPLDNTLLRSLDSQMAKQQWFKAEHDGKRFIYKPLAKAGEHRTYYDRYWGEKNDAIQRVIGLFKPLRTREAEIIATLYTGWNDLLLAGRQPTDDEIIHESSENWHDAKKQITQDEWQIGFHWMRKNELIPRGTGRATKAVPTPLSKGSMSARVSNITATPAQESSVIRTTTAQSQPPHNAADDFELVAPGSKKAASAQTRMDITDAAPTAPTTGLPQPLMRVRLNGQPATVYAIEPAGEATAYTAVLDSEKAPRKFMVPPARIERLLEE